MDAPGDRLMQEFRDVLAAAEELLGSTSGESAERIREMRNRTEEAIRNHPLAALGVAAGIGLVLGLLLARK